MRERERETGRDGEKVKVKERRRREGTSSVAAGGATTARMQTKPAAVHMELLQLQEGTTAPSEPVCASQARPKATPEPLNKFL